MTTRPVNCFLLYCQDYRTIFSLSNPTCTNAEITSLLAKNWRNLDPKIKSFYKQKAKKLHIDFKSSNQKPKDKKANSKNCYFSFKVESLSTPIVKTNSCSNGMISKPIKFIPSKYIKPTEFKPTSMKQKMHQEYPCFKSPEPLYHQPMYQRPSPPSVHYQSYPAQENILDSQISNFNEYTNTSYTLNSYYYPYGPEHEWYYNLK